MSTANNNTPPPNQHAPAVKIEICMLVNGQISCNITPPVPRHLFNAIVATATQNVIASMLEAEKTRIVTPPPIAERFLRGR